MKSISQRPYYLIALLAAVIIVVLPFHAFLTVWLGSLIGQYTAVRLWKEVILIGLIVSSLMLLKKRRLQLGGVGLEKLLGLLIALYLGLLLVGTVLPLLTDAVTLKAAAFGLLLDSRFILFFLIVWAVSCQTDLIQRNWRLLLLIPAAITILFGLLQFTVLPIDFLSHFGYGSSTIDAVQTIDQKDAYQRIQSTMRGANPFGAYLVIIIAAAGALIVQSNVRRRNLYILLFATGCAALALTFSRSAWIGVAAALLYLLWQALKTVRSRQILVLVGSIALLVFAAVGYNLRDNDVFQNTFFHTDETSKSLSSSNEGHFTATAAGIRDISEQPFGRGVGTAGPASVYNDQQGRIAENYFVQIGQEIGAIGLVLFAGITVLIGWQLWLRRSQTLAHILLASLIGITLINFLSHAWTDDTLAYIWWGLAGAAIALPVKLSKKHVN